MYALAGIGAYRDVWRAAEDICKAAPKRRLTATYSYTWSANEPGAPARVKAATAAQIARWPELEPWRNRERWVPPPHLLWTRV